MEVQKRNAGRPPLRGESKKPRKLWITETNWKALRQRALQDDPRGSISELIGDYADTLEPIGDRGMPIGVGGKIVGYVDSGTWQGVLNRAKKQGKSVDAYLNDLLLFVGKKKQSTADD